MFLTILFILFISLLFFALYRISLKYPPKIISNPDSSITKILSKMSSIKKPYKPTPFLFNCHLQTLWGLRLRGKTNYKPKREEVFFEDGGQVTIDYFEEKNLEENASLVFVVHTLGGGTRESCTNYMAYYLMKKKYRVIIATCRGCNGSKITSKRLYNGYQTDDLHTIINHVTKKFPKYEKKFIVGFSLGAMITAQYGVDFNDIDGIVCISHTLECEKALKSLDTPLKTKLYVVPMMKSLHHVVAKSTFYEGEQREKALKSKTVQEFDDIVTSQNLGLKSHVEYYELMNLKKKINVIKVPMLFIMAEDDPFSSLDFLPKEEILKSENVAFVITKEGGHVGFCQGVDGKSSYAEEVTYDFFKTIKDNKV